MPNFAAATDFSVLTVKWETKEQEDADRNSTTFHVLHGAELITSHTNEQLCDWENKSHCLTTEVALEMVPCPHHCSSLAKLIFIQSPACTDTSYLLKLLRCKVPDTCFLLHTKKLPIFSVWKLLKSIETKNPYHHENTTFTLHSWVLLFKSSRSCILSSSNLLNFKAKNTLHDSEVLWKCNWKI